MPNKLPDAAQGILADIAASLTSEGWQVSCKENALQATQQTIVSRWLLGSRKVWLALECDFDAASKLVHYRQAARETVIGLPPPTFSFARIGQRGFQLKEIRRDTSLPAGGGEMRYGEVSDRLQSLCAAHGWKLEQQIV